MRSLYYTPAGAHNAYKAAPYPPTLARTLALPTEYGTIRCMTLDDLVRKISQRQSLPFWILAVGLVTTLIVTWIVAQSNYERDLARFNAEAERVVLRLANSMETYETFLRSGSGLFAANQSVTADMFRRFADQLDLRTNYPALQGIGYSARIRSYEVPIIESRMRAAGFTDFRIIPDTARDEYRAILYLEPLDERNRAAIGFDMSTEPVRRIAMERARDTGSVALSGKVTLVQEIEEDKQAGFLLYFPLYHGGTIPDTVEARREQFRGHLYIPFRADDMMRAIFEYRLYPLNYAIYDGTTVSSDALLHASPGFESSAAPTPVRFSTTTSITIAGNPWTLHLISSPAFESEASRHKGTTMMLIIGTIGSFLLFGLVKFQQTAQAAERRTRKLQDEFMAMASHELKTPITSVKSYAQLLIAKFSKSGNKEAMLLAQKMDAQLNKLTTLISELLDATKIQAGKLTLHPAPCRLTDLVREVIDEMQHTTETHRIDCIASNNVTVYADCHRIGQILSNLISNAIKYSPDADRVVVRLTTDGSRARICVRDFGIGIPEVDQDRIFDRFFRLEHYSKEPIAGVGLGLYISAEIARRHECRIWVESPPRSVIDKDTRGSCFCLELPILEQVS